jgi:hypothetical protein
MVTVATSRIGYAGADGLDTTVKSATGVGKLLAPTWALVGGIKRWQRYPALTPEAYTEQYYHLLRARYKANAQPFLDLLAQEQVVILCYCPADSFCHRHLAVDILEKIAQAHSIPFTRGGELPVH